MFLDLTLPKHLDLTQKSRQCLTNLKLLNPTIMGKDDCCELGKWLYGEGKNHYGCFKHFPDLLNTHAEFHLEARKIALAAQNKTQQEVATMMADGSVFSIAVLKIAHSIECLKKEIKER